MSIISDKIKAIHSTLEEGEERRKIKPFYVDEALDVLKHFHVSDSNGLFFYLASINLLNAAIKMKEFKTVEYKQKRLTYNFIKGKAEVIVEFVIAKKRFNSVLYHYNADEKCLYIKVYDVVFSFHQVEETDFIRNVAAKEPSFAWPGIRLQWIAEDVFLLAKDLVQMPSYVKPGLKQASDLNLVHIQCNSSS